MRYMRMITLVALLVIGMAGTRNVAAQTASVSVQDFKFEPATLTVTVGTTVNWKNDGAAPHTVTGADGSWTSDTMNAGGTYSQTFNTVGEFAYYCKFHGAATGTGMAGKIVVTAANQPQPTAAPTQAAPAGPKPSLTVSDQPATGGKIMVSNVVAAQDGWVVVHKTGPDGKLLVTPIIGQTQVKAGSTDNVEIMLTEAVKAGDTVYPMLHIDEGVKGTYEFPGGPDTPVQVDGNVVVKPVKITAASGGGTTPPPSLPSTGNSGTIAFWLLGAAALLTTLGLIIRRRRTA